MIESIKSQGAKSPMKRKRLKVPRAELKFVPQWKGEVEGWVVKYIAKHLWRIVPLHDFDDAYQEAYECFLRLVIRYPNVADPPHFMSLMQVTILGRMNDLANQRRRSHRPLVVVKKRDTEVDSTSFVPDLSLGEAAAMSMVDDMPEPARSAVRKLLVMSNGRRRLLGNTARSVKTLNYQLCRLSGIFVQKRDRRTGRFVKGKERLTADLWGLLLDWMYGCDRNVPCKLAHAV